MKSDNRTELELEILYKISHAMAHEFDINALLEEILDILETEMKMMRGTLTLRQRDSDMFMIEASRGLTDSEKQRGQYRLGEGVTGTVAKTGKPAIIPDISKDDAFLYKTRSRMNANMSFICVPIIHQNQVIGTMSVDRPRAEEKELQKDLNFLI